MGFKTLEGTSAAGLAFTGGSLRPQNGAFYEDMHSAL